MRIAVDAMGGDYAPEEIVRGALLARQEYDLNPVLVGNEEKIRAVMNEISSLKLDVVHASEVVTMEDAPARALRRKKQASVLVAARMLKQGEAQALVSAGSTGATMVASLLTFGRIKGIERPSIATLIPNRHGGLTLLLDVGASVDPEAKNILHSALMGEVYAREVFSLKNPKLGLLNVGEEEGKGNRLVVSARNLIEKYCPSFCGNAEGSDIFNGDFDVIVCDGFVGNVALKTIESTASLIIEMLKREIKSSLSARLASLLMRPQLESLRDKMDYASYGGAPLLGVAGNVIISHGCSRAKAIKNAIFMAAEMGEKRVINNIAEQLKTIEEGIVGENDG